MTATNMELRLLSNEKNMILDTGQVGTVMSYVWNETKSHGTPSDAAMKANCVSKQKAILLRHIQHHAYQGSLFRCIPSLGV